MGMVNKYTFLLLTASAALFFGCSKEQEEAVEERHYSDYFTAEITPYGDDEKTYIEAGGSLDYSCWADEDAVNINGIVRAVDVNTTDANYSATIGADGIETVNGGFLAAYPGNAVSVSNNTATFTLPAATEYTTVGSGAGVGAQVVEAPMVAYTTARSLQFENVGLLTLFNLNIEGSGQIALQRITISCDQPLSGSYSLTRQSDGWQRDATGLEGTSRALVCNSPVTLNTTAKPFYLYLPPVAGASTFTVDVQLTVNGVRRHFTKTKTGSLNLVASKCYDFGTLTYHVASGTLTDHNSIEYTEKEPAGTEEDPYRISNASEWYYWCGKYATTSGKHFLLEDNFSVGESIEEMKGTLNGAGHTVTVSNCALFNHMEGGTIKNIITEGTITTYYYSGSLSRKTCGAIICHARNITLLNCTNKANILHTGATGTTDLGGLVGYIDNTSGSELNNCRNEGNITGASDRATFFIGGIAGNTSGMNTHLINCRNSGSIDNSIETNSSSTVAGLVAKLAGSNNIIENSYSIGGITGKTNDIIAGIVGEIRANNTIQNCYCYSSNNMLNLCKNCHNGITIQYCYSAGPIVGDNTTPTIESYRLTNATTISGGGSLYTQLNANIAILNINATARQWTESGGYTVFVE